MEQRNSEDVTVVILLRWSKQLIVNSEAFALHHTQVIMQVQWLLRNARSMRFLCMLVGTSWAIPPRVCHVKAVRHQAMCDMLPFDWTTTTMQPGRQRIHSVPARQCMVFKWCSRFHLVRSEHLRRKFRSLTSDNVERKSERRSGGRKGSEGAKCCGFSPVLWFRARRKVRGHLGR